MKKSMLIFALSMVLILLFAGCSCRHEWYAATCAAPKTCSLCGETEGEALPHTWKDATCTDAKTCAVCEATEGEALGHTWQEATCTDVKTCTVCKATEGEALGHTWQEATCTAPKTCSVCQLTEGETVAHQWLEATTEAPKTCSVCQETSGSKLQTDSRFTTKSTKALQGTWICDGTLTDEILSLENFGGVECRITLKFGNAGKLTMRVMPKDEKGFMERYKTYTIDLMYAIFAQQGLSKTEADAAMVDTYGMTVERYVETQLQNQSVEEMFSIFNSNEVYYVEDNQIYAALAWDAKFVGKTYTLTNGTLVIDGLKLPGDDQTLVWKRS